MIDHRVLHNATLMNAVHALHFIAESWSCVTHTTVVNCFHKFGFNLNDINDDEDATELNTAKDDWGQLQAAVLREELVC
jgi:hypothetical protein